MHTFRARLALVVIVVASLAALATGAPAPTTQGNNAGELLSLTPASPVEVRHIEIDISPASLGPGAISDVRVLGASPANLEISLVRDSAETPVPLQPLTDTTASSAFGGSFSPITTCDQTTTCSASFTLTFRLLGNQPFASGWTVDADVNDESGNFPSGTSVQVKIVP